MSTFMRTALLLIGLVGCTPRERGPACIYQCQTVNHKTRPFYEFERCVVLCLSASCIPTQDGGQPR